MARSDSRAHKARCRIMCLLIFATYSSDAAGCTAAANRMVDACSQPCGPMPLQHDPPSGPLPGCRQVRHRVAVMTEGSQATGCRFESCLARRRSRCSGAPRTRPCFPGAYDNLKAVGAKPPGFGGAGSDDRADSGRTTRKQN